MTTPYLTEEDAINAKLDAQTLETWTNGSATRLNPGHPNGTVTSRLGATYPVLAKISDDLVIEDPDVAVVEDRVARAIWALDWQLPSAAKPIKMVMIEHHRMIVDIYPPDASYRDGYERCQDDITRYELFNLAEYHSLNPVTQSIWTLASIHGRRQGLWTQHANFSFDRIVGGQPNTGLSMSIFDPVLFLGKSTDSLAQINTGAGAGPGHGRITYKGEFIGVDGGANIQPTLKINDVIECSALVFGPSWGYLTNDGSEGATVTGSRQFLPASNPTQQYIQQFNIQFTNLFDVDTTVGYYTNMPNRWANRIRPIDRSGVKGTTRIRTFPPAGESLALGQARVVSAWNTCRLGHCVEFENNAAYVPYRDTGGVQHVAYEEPMFGLNNGYGIKIYGPIEQGSTTRTPRRNTQISSYVAFNVVMADAHL